MPASARGISAIFGAALLVGVVAGCSDTTDGTAQPPDLAQPSGSSPPPADNLTVQKPLDAESYLNRPCDLVGSQTVAEFGGLKAMPDVNSDRAKNLTGPLCTWDSDDSDAPQFHVAIQVPTNEEAPEESKGIRGFYQGHEDGLTDYLEPVEIPGHPGYPAVFAGSDLDKEVGNCSLFVGITDTLTFVAGVTDRKNPSQACAGSLKVAASVLDTLKKGA